MKIHNIVGALALISLAGCATDSTPKDSAPMTSHAITAPAAPAPTAPAPSAPPPAAPTVHAAPSDADTVTLPPTPTTNYQIVRYIGTNSSHWQSTPSAPNYADLYTRLELLGTTTSGATPASTSTKAALRDYKSEDDGWLTRVFFSKSETVTTLVDVSISDPTLKVAIPLFSITHSSGSSLGNVWSTNFTSSNVESPLFRIGPNTGITVHLNTKVSQDLKSQGAAMAIGAITGAVQIAAPASPLLTTLSKYDAASKASAVDQAISNLVSHDISEDIELGRLADSWTNGAYLQLYGCAPFVRTESPSSASAQCASNKDIDGGSDTNVGEWSLILACPRLSVFDARDICNSAFSLGGGKPLDVSDPAKVTDAHTKIAASASDAQILSFNLSSQVSVESFVQSQSWYTTFIGKGTTQTAPDYINFCTAAMLGLETNGLNKFDSALVLRSIIQSVPQVAALKANFAPNKPGVDCVTLLSSAQAPLPQ